jgi:hypothetical protein
LFLMLFLNCLLTRRPQGRCVQEQIFKECGFITGDDVL